MQTSVQPNVKKIDNIAPEYQITVRLLNLVDKTDYQIIQENGQRRLTAPEIYEMGQERPKGAEVFIGRLPRNCYEDELMPMLEKVDRLMELRLMLDFSGSTRGYAFALFKDSKTARRACEMLNNYEIRPGRRIGVVKSIDNCRLFFGGVPKEKTKAEFLEELTKILDGIIDVHVYPNVEDRRLNRGFLFVEFKDHKSAAMARRKLIPGKVVLWNHEIAVDWANPEPGEPIDNELMDMVSVLFIRNLTYESTQQEIKDQLQKYTNIPILKIKKINHFAFVHYESRKNAEQVLDMLKKPGSIVEQNGWEVNWAKPVKHTQNSERKRNIIEAITNSSKCKQNTCKQQDKNFQNYTYLTMLRLLDYFVTTHIQGKCFYEILQTFDPCGYVCKIVIFKDQCIYFEHFGCIMFTKDEAIETAAAEAYDILQDHSSCIAPMYVPVLKETEPMIPFLYPQYCM